MGKLLQLVVMIKMIKKITKNQAGFTLIEMMVAVSIFVIVAFIVVSTMLSMSYAYKKAQKMRLLIDNLGFSLQSMSLNIREGINYNSCGNVTDGCDYISFKPIDSWLENSSVERCFSLSPRGDGTSGIKKCEDGSCPCSEGQDIVSPNINITKLAFILSDSSALKKSVKIMIGGEAGINREKSNFFIQTTVSQRNNDE
jgi:prepilin-type N-terminal cleavage/methylation domain-containing protein